MPNHVLKAKTGKFRLKGKRVSFRVGDKVKVVFGNGRASARIIEDRGPIGVKGRRLVRVQLIGKEIDPDLSFEVPVEELIRS